MLADRAKFETASSDSYVLKPAWRLLDPVDLDDEPDEGIDADTWTKPSEDAYRRGPDSGSRPRDEPGACGTPLYSGRELGSYRLLERLGRGAQGEVWKAVRVDRKPEPVAVKILRPSLASNPARRAQFLHEAERGGRLSGASLLTVTETAEAEGYCYMVMPYISGISLRDVIHWRAERKSGEDALVVHEMVLMNDQDYLVHGLNCLIQAAFALERLHVAGIVHRDVKPANILLDERVGGGVYLCDLGLGRDLGVATPEQMRDGAGTPIYMAPERLMRRTADEVRCDVYSLGVTAFETLVLERPYRVPRGLDHCALAAYLVRSRPVRPSIVRREFPIDLEAIIMKAMARDPQSRHGSARDFGLDLERFADHWRKQAMKPKVASRVRRARLDPADKTNPWPGVSTPRPSRAPHQR